jgi:hypothetical protein
MNRRMTTVVLATGLSFSLLLLAARSGPFRLPGNQQGYEPVQPIAYSHRLHAGELQIACTYCHFAAENSRHAGIPAASVCMNCHKFVTASFGAMREDPRAVSPELQKLFTAVRERQPIAWTRVHQLPDFAYFDHRPHVAARIECQQCHGPVETMERVRQVSNLSMGWCVNCHRQKNASTDCSACHF